MFKNIKNIPVGILSLCLFFCLLSCNSDKEEPMISLYGTYVLTGMVTDGQFDFLNVGEVTNNLKGQIEASQGFNFDNVLLTFLEGSPDVFNMNLMEASVLTTLPDNIPLIRYVNTTRVLNVGYRPDNREFSIINNYPATSEIGQVSDIELLNRFQIKVTVPQRIYDYNSKAWVNTAVTYTFNRLYV